MFDVIVCGSLHLDVMVRAPRLPGLDETLAGSAWGQQCGGKGGNQAVMAARIGARTAMIGRVGDDGFGRRLLDHLASQGVDTRSVAVDRTTGSGMSVAIVDTSGDYAAVIVSGANLTIPPESVAVDWAELDGAAILVLQNEVAEAVNVAAAREARAAGAKVLLNAAPVRPMDTSLLDLVDILVVNRVEAAMLAGRTVDSEREARATLPVLAAAGRSVLITLGAGGIVGQDAAGQVFAIPGLPVQVVSTHGAGDAFIGSLVARLATGAALEAAAHAANAAAAAHVSGQNQPCEDRSC